MSRYSPEELAQIDADRDRNINLTRYRVHDRLRMILSDLTALDRDVAALRENDLYDVDFEGHEQVYDDAMRQIRVGLAAVAGSVPQADG